jgi:MFS transporter, ACS family, glucarate transporter
VEIKRYFVVFALFIASIITYLDRACISAAKDAIAGDLALSDEAMGMVFGAFALGYALAQVPSGWFADKYGPRLALATVVTLWSLLTALTGAVRGFAELVTVRFLFGIAEAGAFPGAARAFYNWLPVSERGRANGIMFSGTRLGAALAFPLFAAMLSVWGWRKSFVVLGFVGVAWALFWAIWFRNHPSVPVVQAPSEKPGPELSFVEVLRTRGMMLAMVQYFAGNFTFFICLSWMLPYLKQRYELTTVEAAGYSMIPLLFGATAQWVAGFMVDGLYRSQYRAWSRQIPGMVGFVLAAGGVLGVPWAATPAIAVAFFTLATFGADLTISPSWAYCMDVGGKNSGAVSGSMNMIGNLGSFVSANAFPYLMGLTGSAAAYFQVASVLNVVSVLCWMGMRSVGPRADRG